jgi:hypothetical protein
VEIETFCPLCQPLFGDKSQMANKVGDLLETWGILTSPLASVPSPKLIDYLRKSKIHIIKLLYSFFITEFQNKMKKIKYIYQYLGISIL